MIDGWVLVLVVVAAIGSGVMAGVFFVFSVMVMRGLAGLPAAQGVAAMQSINAAAYTPLFLLVLAGTAAVSAVLVVASLVMLDDGEAGYVLAGGLLYLLGSVVPTGAYHVPRNDALAELDPEDAETAAHWRRYLREWTAGNHVRSVVTLAAATVLVLGLAAA